ncbi:MAG: sigma 54-interacting transcriptional regulator [Planctomycetaceae bacterium]|nr:sigma 54-interacting transcriptional regulator [Planctomycetota bacterium]NUN53132.1 sigma 54-interacting transcriptional regulator [Planctomycetaceae bacterium]
MSTAKDPGKGAEKAHGKPSAKTPAKPAEGLPAKILSKILPPAEAPKEPGEEEGEVPHRETAPAEHGPGPDLRRLTEIARALNSEPELRHLLDLILDRIVDITGAERAFLILRNPEGKLEVRASRSLDREEVKKPTAKVSRSILVQAEKSGRPVLTTNATQDPRFAGSDSVAYMKLRAVVCIPMIMRGRSVGLLYLDHRFEEGAFQGVDLGLLEAFGAQAAIALENARLLQENRVRQAELERSKEKVEELNRVLREKVRRQSAELDQVKQVLRERHGEMKLKYAYPEMIGRSRRHLDLLRLLDRVIDTQVTVLIHGESGSGKELVARAIHYQGARKDAPFVSENCSAIPETLLESELFGYMRGAFTGADRDRKGLFEQASGGTLFLDEIGDMPPEMQSKLLRVLESGKVRPVGGKDLISVNVRVLAASHQDLRKLVEAGRFREDLFYRLAVITVEVPPLRDRREDVPLLVERFLDAFAAESGGPRREVAEEAMALLSDYDWPGNVRELRNEVFRACALSEKVILTEILSPQIRERAVPRSLPARLDDRPLKDLVRDSVEFVERRAIQEALARTQWVKTETARILGISRPTLDAKIQQYGLEKQG